MQMFSRNWLGVFGSCIWKIRLLLLAGLISSVLFGCPINYIPAVTGRVLDAATNKPVKDARVQYDLSQLKSTAIAQSTFTAADGSFYLPMKLFASLIPSGYTYFAAYHPLYEFIRKEDMKYDFFKPISFHRKHEIRLRRFRDLPAGDLLSMELTTRLNAYSGWSVPNSKTDPEAIKNELLEIAAKNKIPLNSSDIPTLVDVLRNSNSPTSREKAADLLAASKNVEVVPHLKSCSVEDRDSNVRRTCRYCIWQMTGEVPSEFTPEDARELEASLNTPDSLEYYSKLKDTDPDKKRNLAYKAALEKYKAAQYKK